MKYLLPILIALALLVGTVVYSQYEEQLGTSQSAFDNYRTEIVALEAQWRIQAFNSLVNSKTGAEKQRLQNLMDNADLPTDITPEQIEAYIPYIENALWQRRMQDYANYLRMYAP